ncbi:MAG TPA: hypothetical protein VJ227_00800 [Patescibacteria group bacterium]|nr:hypothetical protein [Patescibacteria group bacterium]
MEKDIESRVEKDVEHEKEKVYQEVSEEVLKELGWKYFEGNREHKFTVLIPQTVSPEAAFDRGFVFAKHQMRAANGRDILPGKHIDHLINYKFEAEELRGEEAMVTGRNPQFGCNYVVLLKI